jgi:hypothetical protein
MQSPFFTHTLIIATIFCSVTARGIGADALTVIDVSSSQGQMVQSAPIQIPAGYKISFVLHHNNDEVGKVANQGVRLMYPQRNFTIVEGPDPQTYRYALTNPFTNSELVVVAYLGEVLGPLTFSVFTSNSVVRALLYVQPSDEQVQFLDGERDQRRVEVPANSVMRFNATEGGLLPIRVEATTPSGSLFLTTSRTPWKPFVSTNGQTFSNVSRWYWFLESSWLSAANTVATQTSSVFTNFFFHRQTANYAAPTDSRRFVVGPANVTFSTATNLLNKTHFGAFSYEIIPANMSYQGAGSGTGNTNTNGSTNTNSAPTKSFTLQLQRSTNLSDWETTDNYYINETSDKAFYRLKPVAQ